MTEKLANRLAALLRRKEALELDIETEYARPAPCGLSLQNLKRRRLALKEAARRLRRTMAQA